MGVQLLQLFRIPTPFRDMGFLSFLGPKIFEQNTDFWEKSFCMEVSIYKSFHMTRNTPTSEILPPPLMEYVSQNDSLNKLSILYFTLLLSETVISWNSHDIKMIRSLNTCKIFLKMHFALKKYCSDQFMNIHADAQPKTKRFKKVLV